MFLSDISIKRPVFATMMMVALVVLGIVSYQRLAIDEYPDITYPDRSTSQTTYPGASPEVMMRQVSKPIEEALNTVQGIKEINSTLPRRAASNVRVTFNLGVDVGVAQQDVQAKVARIRRSLPPNIDEPIIQHFDPNDSPIMSIAMQSNERGIRELTDLADEVVAIRLEAIQGVGGVNVERRQRAPDQSAARSGRDARVQRQSRAGHARRCSARIRKCRRDASRAARPSGSSASPAASSIPRRSPTSPSPSATACRSSSATSRRSSTAPRSAAPRPRSRGTAKSRRRPCRSTC